jgi:hypothetical protein
LSSCLVVGSTKDEKVYGSDEEINSHSRIHLRDLCVLLSPQLPIHNSALPASLSRIICFVIPAKAGTHLGISVVIGVCCISRLGSRLRGNDEGESGNDVCGGRIAHNRPLGSGLGPAQGQAPGGRPLRPGR